ncbi:putative UDP-3-O-acyl-N-acetylglucosamine deacetylase 2 isoform X3 [Cucumis melo var. makuwa]|uniref:Putative UDP-3-O-acyl-N-acetylglucosamine deacetylase 2 isoform X3 n=1 Tax=Cucumis melo var. makuwa TaxID=1194695 RepID=A0A5D3BL97_CUCMM|nr:putative UDP-3-O-acyl-N-acetylglucosamine deacetylase 2 isoform X3 [Cucumis melo var. makuwa]
MIIPTAFHALKSSRLQQTLAGCLELSGISLHSGKVSKVKLCPEFAGRGRYFDFKSNFIPASIDYAEDSPLCTTLSKDGFKIRTVEHLLSAMEAMGVDNCRIEITNEDAKDSEVEREAPPSILLQEISPKLLHDNSRQTNIMSDSTKVTKEALLEETNKSTAMGDIQNIHPSYQLDGKNYLKWSQLVRTFLKGKEKLDHITGTGPKLGDPKFDAWDKELNDYVMVVKFDDTYN